MMNRCLISIIVPIYNIEQYLEKCLESIISQTYQELEIILIDDGSTDGSGRICDKFAERDTRIIVIHQKNKGLVVTRKVGINQAKGEYVGFVDGDDFIDPRMFERLVEVAENTGVDIVHSGFFFENYMGKMEEVIPLDMELTKGGYSTSKIARDFYFESKPDRILTPSIWSKLYRKEIISCCYNQMTDEQSYGEDALFLFICLCEKVSIKCVPEAYYHYLYRNDSMSNDIDAHSFKKRIGFVDVIISQAEKYGIYNELESVIKKFLFNSFRLVYETMWGGDFFSERYQLRDIDKYFDKRVILYGAGNVGSSYYSIMSRYQNINVISWVDKRYKEIELPYYDLKPIDSILDEKFDYIVIAVAQNTVAEYIKRDLINLGVSEEKIVWEEPR